MIKKLARWILKEELRTIEIQEQLIDRLRKRLIQHLPEIKANREDQTDNINFHADVTGLVILPKGDIKISSSIVCGYDGIDIKGYSNIEAIDLNGDLEK